MKRPIPEIFAARLEKWLDAEPHGRQREIAEAVGISPSRLNNIIKGRRGGDEDLRRAICKFIKGDYEAFLFGPGNYLVTGDEVELQEFIGLYRQYGTPAFLRACTRRLMKIKEVIENDDTSGS